MHDLSCRLDIGNIGEYVMYGEGNRGGGFRPRGDGGFPPVKVGEEIDVRIEAVGEKGDGIARKRGFVLFVPNTREGDEVRIRITKVLRKVGFAEVIGQAQGTPESSAPAPAEEAAPQAPPEPEPAPEDSEDFGEEAPEEEPMEEAPAEEPAPEPEAPAEEAPEEPKEEEMEAPPAPEPEVPAEEAPAEEPAEEEKKEDE
jgi:predicted RNA-binding protein with TRAM domain